MKNLFQSYLKGVNEYRLKVCVKSDIIIVLKKIINIDKPFTLNENGEDITILDNGYSIIEYMPLNEKYICRIHLDNNLKVIEYFFTLSLKNKFENNMPLYDDVKLSVVYCNGMIKLYNEEVLKKLLDGGKISKLQYEEIYCVANSIMEEIRQGSNKIINNVKSLIKGSDI